MRLFYSIWRKAKIVVKALPKCPEEVKETEANDNATPASVPVQHEETPMEVEETVPVTAPSPPVPVATAPVTVSASTSTEPKASKSNKRSAPATIQTVTIVPPINPATLSGVSGAKNSDSVDQSGQGEPRTKRLCLKVAVSDPSKSPSNSHSPSASVTFASPLSSPSACSSTTSESSSSTGKSSKHKHKSKDKDKDKEGKSKESKHHKHKESSSSKELLRIKEYLKAQELGTKVKDKSREGKERSKEHHHHHHHHKSKDGAKGKSSSKTKDPKIKEAIPKFKMATKLKDMPKLTQTVKIKDMPEIRPVEKETVVAKEPPIKIKEILKNKDAKYKEVYTFTQNPQKSKELSAKSKDYVKFREFPKSSKIKEKKKDKSHKQRRSSLAGLIIPTEITVTKTFVPPVETIPAAPTSPAQVQIVESEPPSRQEPQTIEKTPDDNVPSPNQTSTHGDPCKIKVATLVIPGFTANASKPTSPKSLPTSPLYSSFAAPERVQIPDTSAVKDMPKRPASTPAAIAPPPDVEVVHKAKPIEEPEDTHKADKDDDVEIPDEADSGRGSDFSSRTEVRSSCDDDIGSPSPTASFSTPPASVSAFPAVTTPPVTITVTKTITPPVVETLPATPTVKELAREKQMENAAKNEALSRKAVVEVKKVDDIRMVVEKGKEKAKSFNPFIKTYSKASYISKDNAVKVANTGSTCNATPSSKGSSSPAVETKNSVENIRINLENNKIEKGVAESRTADVIKSPTLLPEISKTNATTEKKTEGVKKASAVNNNGGNNNGGDRAEEPKKAEVPSKGNVGKELAKTITISIKTPTCPMIQNRVEDKNVRSPPPPVPSPKLPEPPVAAVGNAASAPSASPPTTATFLQPSLHLSPPHSRGNPTSPQYQIFSPNKGQFPPPIRGDHLGKVSGKGKCGPHSPHHHHHHHHPHQPTVLPLIVRQSPPHHYNKNPTVDRKRKEGAPSTSTGASPLVREPAKDDIGALDLSVAPRHDRPVGSNPSRARNLMVANPPVLDKHRIATCLQAPKINFASGSATQATQMTPSTSSMNITGSTTVSIAPSPSPSASSNLPRRQSSDASRIYHRAGVKNLTVINQPGDSPKIVIKNIPLPLDNNRSAKSNDYAGGQHGHQLQMASQHRSV